MNKQLVLVAAVALLTALGVPSALAAAIPVTPANGNDVVLPDGSVYQGNDDGTFSWIPDLATADAMGIDWSDLQSVSVLPGPAGTPFPSVLVNGIAQANGNDVVLPNGSVYQENADGSYSWIPTLATANAMGVNWGSLQQVDVLPGPVGPPFPAIVGLANAEVNPLAKAGSTSSTPAPEVAVTPANGNDVILPDGSIWQGNSDGSYSWIPDVATAKAMGLNWNTLQSVDSLPGPVGTPFTPVD
jgi:hypothetical protein